MENINIIYNSLSQSQIADLMELYKEESWCNARKTDDVTVMLKNSWTIALTDGSDGKLIGFARVLSDFVYRAFIYDVIVAKDHRAKGYGKLIVESILNHYDFKNIERLELYCVDKNVPFYERLGFKKVPEGTNMMRCGGVNV